MVDRVWGQSGSGLRSRGRVGPGIDSFDLYRAIEDGAVHFGTNAFQERPSLSNRWVVVFLVSGLP